MEAIVFERLRYAATTERPELAFVGDSSCLTGIQPNRIEAQTGLNPVVSFCMFGSVGPVGDARVLSILSERGRLPKRIVVMIHPAQFSRSAIAGTWVDYVGSWDPSSPSPSYAELSDGFGSNYGNIRRMIDALNHDGFLVDPGTGPRPRNISMDPSETFEDLYRPLRKALAGLAEVDIRFVLAPSPESMAHNAESARLAAIDALGLTPESILQTPLTLPDDMFATYTHLNQGGSRVFSDNLAEILVAADT